MAARLLSRLASGLGAATQLAARSGAQQTRQVLHAPVSVSQVPTVPHFWWPVQGLGSSSNFASARFGTTASPTPAEPGTGGAAAAATAPSETGAAAPALASAPAASNLPETLPEPKPELVEKLLSVSLKAPRVQRQVGRQSLLREFQRHSEDTGSPQVMAAMWTQKVRELVQNLDVNRKDKLGMRQLEMMVNRRRRMLIWLRRADFEAYSYTIAKLGLRDIYTPTGIADRYREGMRPTDQADDSVTRYRFNFHRKYWQKKTTIWRRLRPQLVAEDPQLQAMDTAAEAAAKEHRQQQKAAQAQAVDLQAQEQRQ